MATADLIGQQIATQQMYAGHIKYLAEWLLNPFSTGGSKMSTTSHNILLAQVSALRTREGLTDDTKVLYDGFILKVADFEEMWDAYKDCSVLGLTELARRRLSDGDPLPPEVDFEVGSSGFFDEGSWW